MPQMSPMSWMMLSMIPLMMKFSSISIMNLHKSPYKAVNKTSMKTLLKWL